MPFLASNLSFSSSSCVQGWRCRSNRSVTICSCSAGTSPAFAPPIAVMVTNLAARIDACRAHQAARRQLQTLRACPKTDTAFASNASSSIVGLPLRTQHMAAEEGKGALAAGEDDDLLGAGLAVQCVEHLLDAIVVGIDQRIIQDDGCPPLAKRRAKASRVRIASCSRMPPLRTPTCSSKPLRRTERGSSVSSSTVTLASSNNIRGAGATPAAPVRNSGRAPASARPRAHRATARARRPHGRACRDDGGALRHPSDLRRVIR